jgi:hypothetical protein
VFSSVTSSSAILSLCDGTARLSIHLSAQTRASFTYFSEDTSQPGLAIPGSVAAIAELISISEFDSLRLASHPLVCLPRVGDEEICFCQTLV